MGEMGQVGDFSQPWIVQGWWISIQLWLLVRAMHDWMRTSSWGSLRHFSIFKSAKLVNNYVVRVAAWKTLQPCNYNWIWINNFPLFSWALLRERERERVGDSRNTFWGGYCWSLLWPGFPAPKTHWKVWGRRSGGKLAPSETCSTGDGGEMLIFGPHLWGEIMFNPCWLNLPITGCLSYRRWYKWRPAHGDPPKLVIFRWWNQCNYQ